MEGIDYDDDAEYEAQHTSKRSRLEDSNPILDWTTSFLSSHDEPRSSKLSFDHDSDDITSKPNELSEVVFIPDVSARSTQASTSRATVRTQSTLLHSEHMKPPPSHPEGVSCSQPLPEDDYDACETVVADDASVVSDSHTTASIDSSESNDDHVDEYASDKNVYIARVQKSLNRLQSSPAYNYSQYHFLIGMLHMQSGNFEEAVESFNLADQLFTTADPENNSYKVELNVALANATVDAAIESVRIGTGDANTLRNAITQAQTALAHVQLQSMEGTSVDVWNDMCLLLLRAAELPGAIQLYEVVIRAFPRSEDLRSNLSACLLCSGDIESAASLLQNVLTNHPSHIASLINYASVLSSQSMHSTAAKLLHLAVEIDPSSFHGWNNLAVQYQLMGEHDKATICFEAAKGLVNASSSSGVALGFNIASHLISRARAATNTEQRHLDITAARQLLTTVLQVQPRSPAAIVALADCLQWSGETSEAMQQYDLALSISPSCFEALNSRGLLALQQRNAQEAELLFTRAISSISPTSANTAPTMMNLVLALSMQRRFTESKSLLETALQLAEVQRSNDESISTLDVLCGCLAMLGSIHRKLGDLSSAERSFVRGLGLDSARVTALNGLALVHADAGKFEEADELFQQIINSSTSSEADVNVAQHNRAAMMKRKANQ